MKTPKAIFRYLLLIILLIVNSSYALAKTGGVTLWHLPDGAIQPQVAVDSKGDVHLIYFKGDAKAGNLFYMRKSQGTSNQFGPIRINSSPYSAGAIGTVRTAQLAIGKDDLVHVVWNGLTSMDAYQAYTKLNSNRTAFEPQRNLITWAKGLDGGGSVTADKIGNVYVTWHAMAGAKDEAGRAVFVAISSDNGKTFAPEKQANPSSNGACGCCGMRAFVDSTGSLYIVYRSARAKINRDTTLLVSRDKGRSFQEKIIDRWPIEACPMSTYSLNESSGIVVVSWETKGKVYYETLNSDTLEMPPPRSVQGSSQKHPFVICNTIGQMLLVWTEGTGWQRGGTLRWEVFDKSGAQIAGGSKIDAIPVWGLATAYAQPDGNFVVIY